jgi:3,4-dihydroxy 2-butanone 4-phosphate synthase/GTP cyclohydrolase II
MSKICLKKQVEALLPTDWGQFRLLAYARRSDDHLPQLVMINDDFTWDDDTPVLVRIHSECMTGDVFHSKRCDCGAQLDYAMKRIAQEGGILIYLRQEGRGIGLINKLKAYNLQDKGLNTAEANVHLGFQADERRYDDAIDILKDLNILKIKLLTNNPLKITALTEGGVEVVSREPIIIEPQFENAFYINTKKDLMGHLF